jgi:hypothetical protein
MDRVESRLLRDSYGTVTQKDVVTASRPSTEFHIG